MKISSIVEALPLLLLIGVLSFMHISCSNQVEMHKINFNSQGGSAVTAVEVVEGQKLDEPSPPTKDGYTFEGWYTDLEYSTEWYFASDTVTSDMTLHAKWAADEYMIMYHPNGATSGTVPTTSIKFHNIDHVVSANVGNLIRSGYTFSGWNTQTDGLGSDYAVASAFTTNAAVTLYGKWTANTYAITYVLDNGTNNTNNPATFTIETSTITLQVPTRSDYSFEGWFLSSDFSGSPITQIDSGTSGNQILYAKWKVYHIRDIGPAGGYIFYDKGVYSNGWQYLEAAPVGWDGGVADPRYVFGSYRPDGGESKTVGTGTAVGDGESNTNSLVSAMGLEAYVYSNPLLTDKTGEYAAKMSDLFELGGCIDWFLPSKEELNQMYQILHSNNLGDFSSDIYWSSSEASSNIAWCQVFTEGGQASVMRADSYRVRPVRAF